MPRPPIALLAATAASPNRDVAREAQDSIGELLRQIQRNMSDGSRLGAAASQLAELSESLASQRFAFAPADHPWLRKTTYKIIRLANRLPARETPLLANQSDSILAVIVGSDEVTTASVAGKRQATDELTAVTEVAAPAPQTNSSQPDQHELGDRFEALSQRPFPTTAGVSERSPAEVVNEAMIPPVENRTSNLPPTSPDAEPGFDRQPKWTHPMYSAMPASPISSLPIPNDDSLASVNPLRPTLAASPPNTANGDVLASVPSRDLLARWFAADGEAVFPVEEELSQRGFSRLSERLVQQLFSDQVEDRLRLVDDVLTEPGVDARPWLLLLADDRSGDVRLVVVTVMATSNDPELIEKAWRVAISDRDPRIASLAERLRERRRDRQSY
ncbi:MAG: hypothetical protein L0Z07_07175 [Planctomycetes bacterium]|nr:hypothetical protein [Planctomycetota bacterium]